MIRYFCATNTQLMQHDEYLLTRQERLPDFLLSYFYLMDNEQKHLDIIKDVQSKHEARLFLDSGAFSGWSLGKPVDLDRLISFYKRVESFNVDIFAALDVIAGTREQAEPGQKDFAKAAEAGHANTCYMIDQGIDRKKLLPCFHMGEDISVFRKILDLETDHVGLSPRKTLSVPEQIGWLQWLLEFATDHKGKPIRKFHGFGVTSERMLRAFPFYSCDSTAWVMTGAVGTISIPIDKGRRMYQLSISDESGAAENREKHFKHMSQEEREQVEAYIRSLGFDPAEIASYHWARKVMNAVIHRELCDRIDPLAYKRQATKSFF